MAKHPTSRRVHRATTDEDKFVTGVLETSVWAKDHSRWMVIAGVSILVLASGFLYYRNVTARRNDAAANQLSQVRATMASGNQQLAKQDLENYIKKFGGTPSGDVARILLGQTQLQTKESQKAVATLEPLAKDAGTPLGYSAALMLAAAYEANKQPAEADRTYLRIADDAEFDFQKREALDRAARLRMEQNNATGAAQLYQRILDTFAKMDPKKVDMQQKNAYEMRLAEIKAHTPAGRS